ncbi:MAG: hypothetical protein ABIQ85_07070 [Cypionkella sp.]
MPATTSRFHKPAASHALARKQASDELGGTGIVLSGLALAFGLLLWMAAGGGLPFDLGPRAEAVATPQVLVYAEASALGIAGPQTAEPVLLAMQ